MTVSRQNPRKLLFAEKTAVRFYVPSTTSWMDVEDQDITKPTPVRLRFRARSALRMAQRATTVRSLRALVPVASTSTHARKPAPAAPELKKHEQKKSAPTSTTPATTVRQLHAEVATTS